MCTLVATIAGVELRAQYDDEDLAQAARDLLLDSGVNLVRIEGLPTTCWGIQLNDDGSDELIDRPVDLPVEAA